MIREVAYDRLPKGLRVELHVRCAEWISERQERDELVEIGAHHLEQACRLAWELERSPVPAPVAAAAAMLRAAAEKAERREGLREAERLYERALELVSEEQPETAIELRLRLARLLAALGRLEEAIERFDSVASDAASFGRADLRGAALVGLGNALQKQGRGAGALLPLADAKAIAEETGDTRLQVQTLFELAQANRDFHGELDVAVEQLAQALELAATLDDRPLLAEGELRLGFQLYAVGDLEQAEAALARSAEIGSELGSRRDEIAGDLHARIDDVPPWPGRGGGATRARGAGVVRANRGQLLPHPEPALARELRQVARRCRRGRAPARWQRSSSPSPRAAGSCPT